MFDAVFNGLPEWGEYLKLVTGLLAIVNPVGAIPIFVGLTTEHAGHERKSTAITTAVSFSIVLIVATFIGHPLLEFFGISIPSFRVGGGILIFMMALAMLQARQVRIKQTQEEAREAEHRENISVVPLAIPILAGPGAISTVILYSQQNDSVMNYVVIISSIIIISVVTWLILRSSLYISGFLGKTGINIFTRIMGLIMAAIAVEFIAAGARQLFPGLA